MKPISSFFICLCGAAVLFIIPSYGYAAQSAEVAFSPSPNAINLIVDTIDHAQNSVDLAAYTFSSFKIADALISAKKRGVNVRMLLDKSQGKRRYKAVMALHDAGIAIHINRHYAIMHDKYLIVDRAVVETGSFNYTADAEKRNAENVIVLRDKEIASDYINNWQKLWDEGEDYSAAN